MLLRASLRAATPRRHPAPPPRATEHGGAVTKYPICMRRLLTPRPTPHAPRSRARAAGQWELDTQQRTVRDHLHWHARSARSDSLGAALRAARMLCRARL